MHTLVHGRGYVRLRSAHHPVAVAIGISFEKHARVRHRDALDAQPAREQRKHVDAGVHSADLCQPRLRAPRYIAEAHVRQHERRPRQELDANFTEAQLAPCVSLDGCGQRHRDGARIDEVDGDGERSKRRNEQYARRHR